VFELCFLLLMTFFVPLVVTCLAIFVWARARLRAALGASMRGRFRRPLRHYSKAGKVPSIVDG
jgi:hypothetical protein